MACATIDKDAARFCVTGQTIADNQTIRTGSIWSVLAISLRKFILAHEV